MHIAVLMEQNYICWYPDKRFIHFIVEWIRRCDFLIRMLAEFVKIFTGLIRWQRRNIPSVAMLY